MSKNLKYNDIDLIYKKFVLPKQNKEYLERYSELPLHKNNSSWRWENKDFPRVIAVLEFEKFMEEKKFEFNHTLSFNSIGDPEFDFINKKYSTDYFYLNDPNSFDLHSFNLEKKDFDFFMINQTLEHVYDPCLVLRNVHGHLKTDGIFYCNVPAFNMSHDTPHHHYVGFTPTGLGCIVKQAGFEILDIGFWGNTEYINYMMNNNDWPDFTKIKNYKSEINKEVICWIFAKKI